MNKISVFFIFMLFFSWNCAPKQTTNGDNISVSIYPQKYIIDKISAGTIKVNVLITAGSSPASYEPTPRQMQQLSHTKAYFKIGNLGFEQVWLSKFANQNQHLQIIDLSKGIKIENNNPHIWMSPKEMQIIALNSYKALLKIYPRKQKLFTDNFWQLKKEISHIDSLYTLQLAAHKGRAFMIFHPALYYLARDYGLTELAIEEHGKAPSPERLTEIAEKAKTENIKLIFIQKEFDRENAQVLARETQAKIVSIDPLSFKWTTESKHILKVLIESFAHLAKS